MAAEITIILENNGAPEQRWEYLVHDKVTMMTLKQIFYKALADKYGLDVQIRLCQSDS